MCRQEICRKLILYRSAWIVALIFSFTFLSFWSVRENGFVNFDDQLYLTENKIIQGGFSWMGIRYAFTTGDVGNWHPITWLSLMLDVQLFGMNAGAHHLVSAVVHAINAILVFLLLRLLTGSLWASAFTAAAFALHPLRVESVAWASERKDLLCAFFGFLSVIAYVQFVRAKALKKKYGLWLISAVLGHALSLMSKPMLVTLPFLLLLLDFWPLRRIAPLRKDGDRVACTTLLVEKAPFFALTIAACVVTLIVQSKAGAVASVQVFPLEARIPNAIVATVAYLQKLFWPQNLCPFYPYKLEISLATLTGTSFVIAVISAFCWRMKNSQPFLLFGWLWYLGLLVPVIGLVQVGSQSMADRYTYLPMIGVVIALTWGVRALVAKYLFRILLAFPAAVILGLLGRLTVDQVVRWRDSETIFNHSLAVTHENAIAHESLGLVLAKSGAIKLASWHFSEAVRIWPNYSDALSDLGLSLSLQGKYSEASIYSQRAAELDPGSERVRYNLARLYLRMGSNDLARVEFANFVKDFPESTNGVLSLAELLVSAGETQEAITLLTNFAKNQDSEVVWFGLSRAFQAAGRYEEAKNVLRKMIAQSPENSAAHFEMGMVLLRQGDSVEAVTFLQSAINLMASAEAYFALAEACSATGNIDAAIRYYEKSLELKPEVPATLNNLAWLLATNPENRLRNGPRAIVLAEKANKLTDGGQPFLLGTLAAAYAEAGRFDEAVVAAQRAIELATAAGQTQVAARNAELLELYRAGKPYHEPLRR